MPDVDRPPPRLSGNRLGLIVGTSVVGLAVDGLLGPAGRPHQVTTEWGEADVVETGDVVVLARHGLVRHRPAHLVDHRANLAALVDAGCDRVLALGSVGSLRPDLVVGSRLVPDDVFLLAPSPSFFATGEGHRVPGFDEPWRAEVVRTWDHVTGERLVDGGVYAQTTGPRFESRAEIRFLATQADVVGMTLVHECVLAGEIGLRYAAVCTVDNLANGIADQRLTLDGFHTGVAANQPALVDALRAVVAALG